MHEIGGQNEAHSLRMSKCQIKQVICVGEKLKFFFIFVNQMLILTIYIMHSKVKW